MTVWGWLGFAVVIYLAALQGIPRELLEAAEIDGATRWRAFWRVQFPLLGPTTLFLVVWLSINALQLFDEIYVITRGGPLASTTVVVYYLFQQAFAFFQAGYATAIAYVVFLAILVLTVVQLLIGRRARPLPLVGAGSMSEAAIRPDEFRPEEFRAGGRHGLTTWSTARPLDAERLAPGADPARARHALPVLLARGDRACRRWRSRAPSGCTSPCSSTTTSTPGPRRPSAAGWPTRRSSRSRW